MNEGEWRTGNRNSDPTTTLIGLHANLFLGPEAKGTFSRYNARIRVRLYATFDGVIKLAGAGQDGHRQSPADLHVLFM
jgi:hypothetical protein